MTPEPKENLTEPEPEPEPERFIGTANDKSVEEITQVTTAPVKPKPSPPEKTVEELIEEVQIDGTQSMPEWLATARDDQVSLSAGISSPSPSPDQDLDGISQAKGHTGSGQGLYSSEFKPAKFINLSQPSFPKSSRRKGHEGAVLLEVHIDSGGTLTTVNILKSSGYVNFDNAGLAAFKDVKAEPATDNGIAVASKKKIRFRFKLRE